MPSTTKADQAIAAANTLMGIALSLRGIRQQVNEFVTNYNNESWSTFWAAMATAAQNADGTLGTADATPNTAHPIDTRVSSQTALLRALPESKLVAMVAAIEQLQNLFNAQAVTTIALGQSCDDLGS